jgi:predicted nicotinamide N-methyase
VILQVGTAYNAWTSSLLLGKYLWLCSSSSASFSDLPIPLIPITSRSILELGCGVGVVGFTAAKLGGRVTMSDFNDDVLRNVVEALQLNELSHGMGGVEVAKLDWGSEGEAEGCASKQRWYGGGDGACDGNHGSADFEHLEHGAQFDIVLAADCCYEPDHPRLLCRFMLASLQHMSPSHPSLRFVPNILPYPSLLLSGSSLQRLKATPACWRFCGACLCNHAPSL